MLNALKETLSKKDETDITVGESLVITTLFMFIMFIPYVVVWLIWAATVKISDVLRQRKLEKKSKKTPK